MVAIMAGCSGKIEIYRDIFKDARQLANELKEEKKEELTYYTFSGTRSITINKDGEDKNTYNETLSGSYSHAEADGHHNYYATYLVNGASKFNIETNSEGAFVWHTTPSDPSLSAEFVYYKFRDVVFSWNGHILSGDYDTLPYEYDTKLLNAVSPSCRILDGKKASAENFTINLNNPVTYKDGNLTHYISNFHVTYTGYKLYSYSSAYEYRFDSIGLKISFSVSVAFDYGA